MIPSLYHIQTDDLLERVQGLVARHTQAEIRIVGSRSDLGNRMAMAEWGYPGRPDRIFLVRYLSVGEQIGILQDLERTLGYDPRVRSLLPRLAASPFDILALVVLHEVAHIKHQWPATRDRDCTLWALQEISLFTEAEG